MAHKSRIDPLERREMCEEGMRDEFGKRPELEQCISLLQKSYDPSLFGFCSADGFPPMDTTDPEWKTLGCEDHTCGENGYFHHILTDEDCYFGYSCCTVGRESDLKKACGGHTNFETLKKLQKEECRDQHNIRERRKEFSEDMYMNIGSSEMIGGCPLFEKKTGAYDESKPFRK